MDLTPEQIGSGERIPGSKYYRAFCDVCGVAVRSSGRTGHALCEWHDDELLGTHINRDGCTTITTGKYG